MKLFVLYLTVLISVLAVGFSSAFSAVHSPAGIFKKARADVMRMTKSFEDTTKTSGLLAKLKVAIENGPIPKAERKFLVNGWRWHTQAVLVDLDRFVEVLQYAKKDKGETLRVTKSYDFVFGFSWKALMKVEREIFFPWLADILPTDSKELVNDIVREHGIIRTLTLKLGKSCMDLNSATISLNQRDSLLSECERLTDDLRYSAKKIQSIQESALVPYIAAYISKPIQEKFNNMVIRKLGLLDAQLHLVSMSEAVRMNPEEKSLFEDQIPGPAQATIPFVKKRFWDGRVECLVLPRR